jgi:hypothetical protein
MADNYASANQSTQVLGSGSNESDEILAGATQWPPLDLYQQIDALISGTNASVDGGQNENNSHQDSHTILQTILR